LEIGTTIIYKGNADYDEIQKGEMFKIVNMIEYDYMFTMVHLLGSKREWSIDYKDLHRYFDDVKKLRNDKINKLLNEKEF